MPEGGDDAKRDRFDLSRFVAAQDPMIDQVTVELRRGRKQSHWMWFVFPQIEGLGSSATARRFAIGSLAEAEAYLEHPVLGPRLAACTDLVNGLTGLSASDIFGWPDDVKFRSSMTLFARASSRHAPYGAALEKYFGGAEDSETVRRLG